MRGRPPVLTIYDKASGETAETINLEKLNLEEMHELLVSRGFVRRPTPLNSSDEDGGVSDKTSKAERPRVDAATAERKLKSTQARRSKAEARKAKHKLDAEAMAEKRRFDMAKMKARANDEL